MYSLFLALEYLHTLRMGITKSQLRTLGTKNPVLILLYKLADLAGTYAASFRDPRLASARQV